MEVSPSPNVTVRVFMLFKGLKEDEARRWIATAEAGENDASHWRSVVGIDGTSLAADTSLFRVVEWGGMEVV